MTVVPYTGTTATTLEPQNLDDAMRLAEFVANTDFVPKNLRGNPPAILAAILYGREVGLGSMQSLAKISVIEGRPTLAAESQRALILAAGHELVVEESTSTRCTIRGRRRNERHSTSVTWTLDDAKRANLVGKQNWRQYPADMLAARALARLARLVFADVIGGLAATEEALEGGDPEPTVERPASTPTTTRRRRAVQAVPEPEPAPAAEPEADPEPEPGHAADDVPADDPHEPPAPMPAPEPARMNAATRGKLFALFGERGMGGKSDADRTRRLEYARHVLGRDVASSTELTAVDASRLIEQLERDLPDPVVDALNAHLDAEAAEAAAGDDDQARDLERELDTIRHDETRPAPEPGEDGEPTA
jgi:hypothetical protein